MRSSDLPGATSTWTPAPPTSAGRSLPAKVVAGSGPPRPRAPPACTTSQREPSSACAPGKRGRRRNVCWPDRCGEPTPTSRSRSIRSSRRQDGGLVARQQIDKLLRRAAEKVGIDATRLGTHVGRRTVVTALYTAGTDIGDIARHVGHASPATTSRYVASLGERPLKTARLAAQLLDTPMTDAARPSAVAEPSKGVNKPRSRATRRTPRAEHS